MTLRWLGGARTAYGVLLLAAACACRAREPTSESQPDVGTSAASGGVTAAGAAGSGGAGVAGESGGSATIPDVDPATSALWAQCPQAVVEENCRDGWCEIPAGCFVMGSPESEWGRAAVQEDQIVVTLTRGFVMQQTEVTQEAWLAQGFANPSGTQPNGLGDCLDDPECPVGRVTWFEALAYANRLSEQHDPPLEPCYVLNGCEGEIGKDHDCASAELTRATAYECEGFRLPTNAEWEYATRAGTPTTFYSGNMTMHSEFETDPSACLPDENLEGIAWYCHNSQGTSHAVGQLTPNGWGLHDMIGNAEEWNHDRADGRAVTTPIDPGGTLGLHPTRNTRGGSFVSWAKICRTAARLGGSWDLRSVGLGFRLVRTGTL
jgi:formylglycine-generating enzyme